VALVELEVLVAQAQQAVQGVQAELAALVVQEVQAVQAVQEALVLQVVLGPQAQRMQAAQQTSRLNLLLLPLWATQI
jgi:hypothetical protein